MSLGIGRKEAAKILEMSVRGVIYLEGTGQLSGIRDRFGHIRFKKSDVVALADLRAAEKEPPPSVEQEMALLDLNADGSYVVREGMSGPTHDLALSANTESSDRWKKEHQQRERELELREREIANKERLTGIVGKALPRVLAVLERGSWTQLGSALVTAVPEETRAVLIQEIVKTFSKEKEP